MTANPSFARAMRTTLALALILAAAAAAPAQGLLGLFGAPRGQADAFCHRGATIRVEVFNPSCPGTYPAVLLLHGADGMDKFGPMYRMAAAELARNGYVTVIVRYFDATGGGPADPESLDLAAGEFRAWVGAVRAAISYAQALPNVDGHSIGIAGFSLGSFVGLSVASTDGRIGAVVDAFGGLPAAYAKRLKHMPPVLILHGQCDDTVPVQESYALAKLLRSKGLPYEIHIYPGQGHTFDKNAQQDASARGLCFFGKHLK